MALSVCLPVSTDQSGRELADHGTPLFPVACYHDDLSEAAVSWHWHEELEVLIVEQGTARAVANGTDYMINQGEGFFVNAGVLHGVWQEGGQVCRLRSVVFHPRLVGGSVDSILWQKYLEPLLADLCRPCVHLTKVQEWEDVALQAVQEVWQSCALEPEGFEFTVRDGLSRLIFLLTKNGPRAEKKPSEKTLRDGRRIKVMLQYIQEHYHEKLTLAEIAASAAISETECLRCFRRMISSTPIQYVQQVRIQKAAERLISTSQTISDIGAECGFEEMSYFAKTFRKLKGCSPGAFRASRTGAGSRDPHTAP